MPTHAARLWPSLFGTLAASLLLTLSLSACSDDDGGAGGGGAGTGDMALGGAGGGAGAGGTGGGGAGGAGGEGGTPAPQSCEGDEACPPGSLCDPSSRSCQVACNGDEDCGPQADCEAGFCAQRARCDEGSPCAAGTVCSCNGLCVPERGAPCQGNLQCATDEFCDTCEGQCRARVVPCGRCEQDSDCERPNSDRCLPLGDRGALTCLRMCETQEGCDRLGPGYRCAPSEGGSYCVPEAGSCDALTACERDSDCTPGTFCNDRAQCQPGCVDDTSCPMGLLCQGIRCLPPCEGDESCDQPGAVCEEGRCRIPGGCQSSADCLEPETYCDLDQLRCVEGCQVDTDCLDANLECLGGSCRPRGCSGNYQCSFGEVCNQESNQCVAAEGVHCQAGCDPMSEGSCGMSGARCLSLQDEEENPVGDFCFEPCQAEPNECPQGYSCVEVPDGSGGAPSLLCVRRCDLSPVE